MNYEEIIKLSEWLDKSSFTTYSLSIDGVSLSISKQQQYPENVLHPILQAPVVTQVAAPASTPVVAIEKVDSTASSQISNQNHIVLSPIVGIYYESASPGGTPFVKVGQKVKKGDVLCLLEAMKLMNEITSDVDGVVEKIYITNGNMVEACMPLFELNTEEG